MLVEGKELICSKCSFRQAGPAKKKNIKIDLLRNKMMPVQCNNPFQGIFVTQI